MVKHIALLFLFLLNLFVVYGQDPNQNNDKLDNLVQKRKAFYKANNLDSALVYAKKIIPLAQKINDSLLLQKTYFRLGYYHDKLNFPIQSIKNYNEGLKIALSRKDTLEISKFYNNIATKQYRFSDYNACEQTIVKHLKLIKNSKYKKREFKALNLLANCYKITRNFDRAINTFKKMEALTTNVRDRFSLQNNSALVHFEKGDYNKAKSTYQEILKHDSIHNYTKLKARVLVNLGFTEFNIKPESGLINMKKGMQLQQQENDLVGLYASSIHLSKYYSKNNKPGLATAKAQQAYDLAMKLKNYESQVEALQLLVKLNPQPEFINRFLVLNDSLQKTTLIQKNQYAGLKFETEEKEKENLKLKQDKAQQELELEKENKRKWFFASGLLAALASLAVFGYYFRRNQKQKKIIEDLQKEMHHRVKNNLATIDTFIEFAKDEFNNEAFTNKLTELQNRIESINEVHSQLYKSKDVTNISLNSYINTLVSNVQQSFNNPKITIKKNIDDNIIIPANKSFPIGLIVNEFLTNSFKYAFKNDEVGNIFVEINDNKTNYELFLSDDGKGLPVDFDIDTVESFGMRIMYLLSEQLNASFELDGKTGVKLIVKIPK